MRGDNAPGEAELPPEEGPTLFEYLETPQGHEVATRIVGVFEAIQKATLESGAEQAKVRMQYEHRDRRLATVAQGVVFVVAVGVAGFLVYHGRFDPSMGILLGTLVGYFFGRRGSL